jgi:aspartyl-tRNA(Asn)/glutamyl-tRNA(Gln) amidotransferase subunit A
MADLADLSLPAAADLLRTRQLSPVDYVQAFLDRIARFDGRLNAFISTDSEGALQAARAAEREIAEGRWRGPLHGVPVALKDIFDVAGQRTSNHSKVRMDHVAAADAFVVTRLRQAGAILIGKTAMHEFATGGPSQDLPWPPARNPWRPTHHPGGSSSGSGVAVAAAMAPVALGTDTAGSIRNPATACGVTGMKPTYGVVSRGGVFPLAFSLDHVGPLTRTVHDNAIVLEALLGRDPADPSSIDHPAPALTGTLEHGVKGLRMGVLQEFGSAAHEDIRAAFEQACRIFEQLGAHLVPLQLSPLDLYAGVTRLIMQAEAFTVHEAWLRGRPGDYGMRGRTRLLPGAFLRAADYIRAQQMRTLLRREFTDAMAGVDAALCISSLESPCPIDDEAQIDRTYDRQARTPFNLTGTPAISVPMGFCSQGLPIGLQVVGRAFDEAMVYRVAHAYQAATDWHLRRPGLDQPQADAAPPAPRG